MALGATALLLWLLVYSGTFKSLFDGATGWAKDVMNARPIAGAAVFFLFSAVSAMVAFTSSVVLVPPANLVWGRVITFLLLWGGWIAGAIAAFGIGNLARPLLIRLGYQAEGIYAFGLIIAGDSLVTARPLRLVVTVGIMIIIAAGAGWLLRKFKKRKLVD